MRKRLQRLGLACIVLAVIAVLVIFRHSWKSPRSGRLYFCGRLTGI